ncbi:MAG TPA: hypothetical protein VGQ44_17130 [Gemmatimonadaceae bacterium]|jgi:hypothetical protein|nr:hypothetical protein [Gemmatimonadaceae bacterium]
MTRIRTIKPEFWGDEKLAPLASIDRLVFLGLISMADDAGRLVDNVKTIDGFIFPESSETARDSLEILARHGRVIRYVSDSGQKIIQVANWLRHQKVDKPSKYVLPGPSSTGSRNGSETPAGDSRNSIESVAGVSQKSRAPTLDLRPTTNDQRPSSRRKPRGEDSAGAIDQPAEHAPPRESWLTPTCAAWESKYGPGSFAGVAGQAAKALAPLRKAGHTDSELGEHLEVYLDRTEPRFVSLARFAQTFGEWIQHPLVDEHGFLNERGLAAMRSE